MTDNEIDELLANIRQGNWVASGNGIHVGMRCVAITDGDDRVVNTRFIAAAPAIVRQLRADVDRISISQSRMRELFQSQIDDLVTERDALREMNARWKSAVEGLTPHGSEYVDDPEACAAAIRQRCQYPKQVIELRERVAQQEREIERLKGRLLLGSDGIGGDWTVSELAKEMGTTHQGD